MIIKCTCAHPQQDKLYGNKRRVGNTTNKKVGDSFINVRCTVCLKEQVVKANGK